MSQNQKNVPDQPAKWGNFQIAASRTENVENTHFTGDTAPAAQMKGGFVNAASISLTQETEEDRHERAQTEGIYYNGSPEIISQAQPIQDALVNPEAGDGNMTASKSDMVQMLPSQTDQT